MRSECQAPPVWAPATPPVTDTQPPVATGGAPPLVAAVKHGFQMPSWHQHWMDLFMHIEFGDEQQ
jgi:hypothetical protein